MTVETLNVSSSHIESVSYDSETREMTITFADGGEYGYSNVPPETFAGFREAPSKGQFFHRAVKNKYSYREL